jgi:hypothetical protein
MYSCSNYIFFHIIYSKISYVLTICPIMNRFAYIIICSLFANSEQARCRKNKGEYF